MELTLSLEGKARRKALAKARRLLKETPARTPTRYEPPACDAAPASAEPPACDGDRAGTEPPAASAPPPYV